MEEFLEIPDCLLTHIIGGFPLNCLVLLAGPPGSGKTTFVANLVKWIKDEFPDSVVVVFDTEKSISLRLKSFGYFNLVDFYTNKVYMEDVLKFHLDIISSKEDKKIKKALEEQGVDVSKKIFIIWDTITATPLKKEVEILKKSLDNILDREFPVGIIAQVFSSFLRAVIPRLENLTLVYVSQIRSKIARISQNEIPGGWALKHAASQIIEFLPAGLEEKGQWVKVVLHKSKFFPPKKGEVFMSYEFGFNERVNLTKMLLEKRIIPSSAGWVKINNKNYRTDELIFSEVLKNEDVWREILKYKEEVLQKIIE